jgi:hypothetical protein
MPNTTRFTLPYPSPLDAPNGPLALQSLAEAAEGWLARAIPCTSDARPGTPPAGMLIRETDTGLWLGWTGTEWEPLTGGAGESTTTGEAQFAASAAQSISSGSLRTVAFGNEQVSSPLVVRAARSTGHEFALTVGGRWAVDATIRYAWVFQDGERYAGLYSGASSVPIVSTGQAGGDAPDTLTFSCVRRFTAGTVLYVGTSQATGGGRILEPGPGGGWVKINFTLIGA